MKKIMTLIICALVSIPVFAQRDIKTFDKIGGDAIIAILGQPDGKEYWGDIMEGYEAIQYPDTYICLDEDTSELVGFNTSSPSFCILSDHIPGGFKVGDRFEKLRAFDFIRSRYGKNTREGLQELRRLHPIMAQSPQE